mmetsp:Transcript_50244/g.132811  ORF Transcript_50244/g.132811 Transcript_50244/m.132811 type:complete len:244 (-) Transcript_50244:447-1178(-)
MMRHEVAERAAHHDARKLRAAHEDAASDNVPNCHGPDLAAAGQDSHLHLGIHVVVRRAEHDPAIGTGEHDRGVSNVRRRNCARDSVDQGARGGCSRELRQGLAALVPLGSEHPVSEPEEADQGRPHHRLRQRPRSLREALARHLREHVAGALRRPLPVLAVAVEDGGEEQPLAEREGKVGVLVLPPGVGGLRARERVHARRRRLGLQGQHGHGLGRRRHGQVRGGLHVGVAIGVRAGTRRRGL